MNFSTINKQRKFVLISAGLGLVSMFLPWISISMFGYSQTVNGMHDKGILVFLCFAVCALIAYLGDQSKNLEKNSWMITLVAAAIALLMMLWFYSQLSDSMMGASFLGFGFYIAAIASLGVLLSAWLFRSPSDNLKDSFNSLKKDLEVRMANTGAASQATQPPSPKTETRTTEPGEPENAGL